MPVLNAHTLRPVAGSRHLYDAEAREQVAAHFQQVADKHFQREPSESAPCGWPERV